MTTTASPGIAAVDRTRTTTLRDELRFFSGQAAPRIEAGTLAVALACRIVVGSWGATDAIVAAVLVGVQPFFEWAFHVYVLHYRPVTVFGRVVDFELARKHREHHADPSVVELVFVPVRSLVGLLSVTVTATLLLLPTTRMGLTALTGAAALLLAYEWTHYLIHSRYRPRTRLFRAICRAHRLHHFKNEQYWFGVTNPTADRVFGTYPDPGRVPTSPTARDLASR